MSNRRTFFKEASWAAAGVILGGQARTAFAESAKEIVIHNDYNTSVEIDLFRPDSINRVFATWTFSRFQRSRLLLQGDPLKVNSDWGIRVRFRNGAKSAVMRLFEVGAWDVKASAIYDNPYANYFMAIRKKKIDGYKIDPRFGATETRILTNALAIFYERFLQNHTVGCPELCTRSAYNWYLNKSDFEEAEDERDYIELYFP